MIELPERPDWHRRAACRGPDVPVDVFFPHPTDLDGQAHAVALCAACPVRGECAEAGLREPHGTWGGMSERARARRRRALKITAQPTYLDTYFVQPVDPESESA